MRRESGLVEVSTQLARNNVGTPDAKTARSEYITAFHYNVGVFSLQGDETEDNALLNGEEVMRSHTWVLLRYSSTPSVANSPECSGVGSGSNYLPSREMLAELKRSDSQLESPGEP